MTVAQAHTTEAREGHVSDIRRLLVCPACREDLPPPASWPPGGARCPGCQTVYRVVREIPRFVETDSYAKSFSFEWLRHPRTQLDADPDGESARAFRLKTGLAPEDVKGKLVLDAGCGMGRFADVVSRWGGQVVAVDISQAVEAAWANLKDRPNVSVCQADLFHLPFREGSFDVIYSLGVLHHTPHCELAFRQLVKYLAPGGRIGIWVYADDRGAWAACADFYRRLTTRLPRRLLYAACHVAIPWYYLCKLPVVGRVCWTLLPISVSPKAEWRVLDTFDWYAPRYQSKHTYPEVYRWFESEGLTAIRLQEVPVSVSGRKPSEHPDAG